MKKLTIVAFAWAVTSALLLVGLSQAGERIMRPEFGVGLEAAEAPPTTGPAGEEIFTDEFGAVPGLTEEGSGDVRFDDAIRGKRPYSEKKAAKKKKSRGHSDKEKEREEEKNNPRRDVPPWLFPDKGYYIYDGRGNSNNRNAEDRRWHCNGDPRHWNCNGEDRHWHDRLPPLAR